MPIHGVAIGPAVCARTAGPLGARRAGYEAVHMIRKGQACESAVGAKVGLRRLDMVLKHKEQLFSHVGERWRDLFRPRFEVLLYDLTSTYFESGP